jgi:uncharacterized protein (TIGR02647 family)
VLNPDKNPPKNLSSLFVASGERYFSYNKTYYLYKGQKMALTIELIEELKVLNHYKLSSLQEGIKVHGSATDESITAAKRLFDKGLVSQADGGYLTDLGIEAAEHIQAAFAILTAHQ